MALRKVYDYALAQPVHPVHASEFICKALDFNRMVVARSGDAWLVRGAGELRTLRAPQALGTPDVAASRNVAGYAPGAEGRYVHLAGGDALLRFSSRPGAVPHLVSANARLAAWQRDGNQIRFALKGYLPLELALGNTERCLITGDGKPLTPRKTEGGVAYFRYPHAAATFQISCHDG